MASFTRPPSIAENAPRPGRGIKLVAQDSNIYKYAPIELCSSWKFTQSLHSISDCKNLGLASIAKSIAILYLLCAPDLIPIYPKRQNLMSDRATEQMPETTGGYVTQLEQIAQWMPRKKRNPWGVMHVVVDANRDTREPLREENTGA